jgi:hypothetical protein
MSVPEAAEAPAVDSASVTTKMDSGPVVQFDAAFAFSDRPDAALKSTAGLKLMLPGTNRMSLVGVIASVCDGCAARSSVVVLPLPLWSSHCSTWFAPFACTP